MLLVLKVLYKAIVTKDSMVLAWIQTHGSVEKNRVSKNQYMNLQTTNFWQRCQDHILRRRTVPSVNGVGKNGYLCAEEWNHIINLTVHKVN
jgi:hypothetical protein